MKKTKKVIDIEARTGKTIQELLFLCVERDYTMQKTKKFIGVPLNKTIKAYINKYAPILSDHKFRHSNSRMSRDKLEHMRRMGKASANKKATLIDGFLMTRKDHCRRLGVSYRKFIGRKTDMGLSDVEALGIDMSWKVTAKEKYDAKYKEKIIELGVKNNLPIKTITYKYNMPVQTSRRVMRDFRAGIESSGLIKTCNVIEILGITESALRNKIRRCADFPKPVKIGRLMYWNKEEIRCYKHE